MLLSARSRRLEPDALVTRGRIDCDDLAALIERRAARRPTFGSQPESRRRGQSERWERTFTIVPLGSRSMNRRTPHSSSRRG